MVQSIMKGIIGFLLFAAIVVGLLLLFPGKKYPQIPADALHQAGQDIAACMECHGQGKKYAMKEAHPPKFECFKCHEWPNKA
jgi:mono/diheme cytochrome c family protein